MRFYNIFIILLLIASFTANSQDSINYKKLKPLAIGTAAVYTGTMIYLSQTWYEEQERASFRFFNDNPEWKQMDKAGHIWTAFHLSSTAYEGLKWSGQKKKQAALWGTAAGLAMILPVEWLDGYSQKYGASLGDIAADFAGGALFIGQHLLWEEVRIIPKFSFHRTIHARIRPAVLGKGLHEEWLKNYNGQTYWLSFDVDKFINSGNKVIPFINLAVGYGAEGMIYGRDWQNEEAGHKNYRQYYLSLDFDLTAIKTNKKWLKPILFVLNTIHLPSPALALSNGKVKFHPVYF